MAVFVTSDLHLGHENVVRFCDRPYSDAVEMEIRITQEWNATVRDKDTIWVLGDFSFLNPLETLEAISKLKGKKRFLRGNHDKAWWTQLVGFQNKYNFELVGDRHEFKHDGTYYVMDHFPLHSWNRKYHGSVHLHGHSHGNMSHEVEQMPNRHDIGWDVEQRLFNIEEFKDNRPK